MVNQTRVWILCFNLHRSTSAQFGKPPNIKEDLCVPSLSIGTSFERH